MTVTDLNVERTVQPCLHKRTTHVHGTRACYVLDKCGCTPCTEANRLYRSQHAQDMLYGRYNRMTDAAPARAHIEQLRAQGMGKRRIALAAGMSESSLHALLYGKRRPDGTRRPLAKRILTANAQAILAVTFSPHPLSAVEEGRTFGATRRVRALVALGWTIGALDRHFGNAPLLFAIMHGHATVTVSAAARIEELYDNLSMKLPPVRTRFERASITRAKKFAADRGWLPPLAIDDETLDDDFHGGQIVIELGEDLDEIAIERRLDGDRTVRLTKPERHEAVRRLHAQGLQDTTIATRLGTSSETVRKDRIRFGLPANENPDFSPVSPEHFSARGRKRREQHQQLEAS